MSGEQQGFRITGTPRPGDVQQVAGNMDDVLPAKGVQIHVVGPKADGSLPTLQDLQAKREELGG